MKAYFSKTVRLTDTPGEYIPVSELSHDYHGPWARADRAAQGQAKNNVTSANTVASQSGKTANQIGSSLIPGLLSESEHPVGYTPMQKNNMLVAGGQAVGGVNSGVEGQAELEAARTRNAGGFANALSEASRNKSRQLSDNALNVNNADAELANKKQMFAQQQLQGLYGTNTADQLKAMGLSDDAINSELAAGRQGWLQNTEGVINTISNAASAGAGVKKAFG